MKMLAKCQVCQYKHSIYKGTLRARDLNIENPRKSLKNPYIKNMNGKVQFSIYISKNYRAYN